jgi:hypothetical protein
MEEKRRVNEAIFGVEHLCIEYKCGSKTWWIGDMRHRENGPAVMFSDGIRMWYLNGKQFTEFEFNKILARKRLNKIT